MKVSIFGASGGTGRLLTERCLAAGYDVTVLLRTPATFPFRDRVRVVEGNVFDPLVVRRKDRIRSSQLKTTSHLFAGTHGESEPAWRETWG